MRTLNTVIAGIFALLVVLFAVSNRAEVDITLWPFPFQATMGVYAVVLLAALVGFLCGMIAVWLIGGPRRRERRRLRGRVKELEESLRRQDGGVPKV